MRVAITGSTGQLGSELCRLWGAEALPLDRPRFPLSADRAVLAQTLEQLRPDLLVNAAAYTLVDQAEREPDLCRAVNALAVGKLAELCRTRGIPLVQVSTDYVFGVANRSASPWCETDPPSPVGVYAASKREGEIRAAESPRHIVVRTCGLYGQASHPDARPHFVATMLRLARAGKPLRVVNDQHCTPSYVPHVARGIRFLAEEAMAGRAPSGIYHLTNQGATTWHDFAAEILRLSNLAVSLKPISTTEYAAPAPRPWYSVLDTSKYHALGGPPMPSWQDALAEYLAAVQS